MASLLYDAVVKMPEEQKNELLDYYIRRLSTYSKERAKIFRKAYYHFVLIRLLQAMGAFGLRGIHERKQHFIDSIIPGLREIVELCGSGKLEKEYPEILRVVESSFKKYFVPLHAERE